MSARRLVYLHGFASSAQSSKGTYLAAKAASEGMRFEAPDLNAPDFSTLTISRMIGQVSALLAAGAGGPVTLIGSSLGAIVALFTAAELVRGNEASSVDTLVLMAPAVDLVPGLTSHFGDAGLREWERTDRLDVFHYGDEAMRPLRWAFFADARAYDPWTVDPPVPTLVFQGTHDEVVDASAVERWCAGRQRVTLHLVDDGHQLRASLDAMWQAIRRFVQVPA
jgi:pimeloyl-ACP methyl ester carboxylesterase